MSARRVQASPLQSYSAALFPRFFGNRQAEFHWEKDPSGTGRVGADYCDPVELLIHVNTTHANGVGFRFRLPLFFGKGMMPMEIARLHMEPTE